MLYMHTGICTDTFCIPSWILSPLKVVTFLTSCVGCFPAHIGSSFKENVCKGRGLVMNLLKRWPRNPRKDYID